MKASVSSPPTRQAAEPNRSGIPAMSEKSHQGPDHLSPRVRPNCSSRKPGRYVMLKYQPYEAQKYIKQSSRRFGLVASLVHGTRSLERASCDSPEWIRAISAALTPGFS